MRAATTTVALLAALLAMLLPLAVAAAPLTVLGGQTMGTTWSVTLDADADELPALRAGVQARLDTVVAQMSTWEPDSDLSRFNGAAAGTHVALPAPLRAVMAAAVGVAADTGGAFDPTVGPLVNLWGFGPGGKRTARPDPEALQATRGRVGWRRLRLDATGAHQPGGLYVDLSAIAKGFAVDDVAGFLLENGMDAFLVEVGGEMRGHGRKPDGSAWRVAVERPDPDDSRDDDVQVVVALDGLALATSGDYRHRFVDGGQRYSHTIDPRSGEPVQHPLALVSVLHEQAMLADALATALSVMGPDEARRHAERHGLAVLLVWRGAGGHDSYATRAFRRQLLDR